MASQAIVDVWNKQANDQLKRDIQAYNKWLPFAGTPAVDRRLSQLKVNIAANIARGPFKATGTIGHGMEGGPGTPPPPAKDASDSTAPGQYGGADAVTMPGQPPSGVGGILVVGGIIAFIAILLGRRKK